MAYIPEATTCAELLEELEELPESVRRSTRLIYLSDRLCEFVNEENWPEFAVPLARFLLEWEELESIWIGMPDDVYAGKDSGSIDLWTWALHRPLLSAFPRGRWRQIRLVHPSTYTDPNIFFYYNIGSVVEDWILPLEPRRLLKKRRRDYSDDWCSGLGRDSKEAVNKDCERVWASRGIRVWRERSVQAKEGTDLVVQWIEPWMREHRQKATAPKPSRLPDPLSWQERTAEGLPEFLRPLWQWRVVLCLDHGNCFAKDGLRHHLIHHHGATEFDANELLPQTQNEMPEMADTWNDVVHPEERILAIPHLPVIRGYYCTTPSCQFRCATMKEYSLHLNEIKHNGVRYGEMLYQPLQTLSSCPDKIR